MTLWGCLYDEMCEGDGVRIYATERHFFDFNVRFSVSIFLSFGASRTIWKVDSFTTIETARFTTVTKTQRLR
jgi:hypothetical protein